MSYGLHFGQHFGVGLKQRKNNNLPFINAFIICFYPFFCNIMYRRCAYFLNECQEKLVLNMQLFRDASYICIFPRSLRRPVFNGDVYV